MRALAIITLALAINLAVAMATFLINLAVATLAIAMPFAIAFATLTIKRQVALAPVAIFTPSLLNISLISIKVEKLSRRLLSLLLRLFSPLLSLYFFDKKPPYLLDVILIVKALLNLYNPADIILSTFVHAYHNTKVLLLTAH